MALEDGRSDEGLLTQVALVLLVAVVHHLDVHVERVLPLEGGVALVALECPLTCGNKDRGTLGRVFFSAYCCASEHTVITHSKRETQFTGRL